MNIVALHLGHNATAALSVDGRIVAAVSEEKADNVKNSAAFPSNAIEWCLDAGGLQRADVDCIVIAGQQVFPQRAYDYLFKGVAGDGDSTALRRWFRQLERGSVGQRLPSPFRLVRDEQRRRLLAEGERELADHLTRSGFGSVRREHVEHHTCHARAALHALDDSQGQEPALILTLDGSGDGIAGSVTTYKPGQGWSRLATVPVEASFGGYYSNTTRFLGMKLLEHEYKVMGLAPYAKEYFLQTYERVFAPVVYQDPANPLTFRAAVPAPAFFEYLIETAVGERFDNIAGAVQHLLEERVLPWVRTCIETTGIRRVFTGGGVFMNVKLNQRIQDMPEVDRAYFMPSCGDESNPMGAAYDVALRAESRLVPLPNLYLGPEFSAAALEQFVAEKRLTDRYIVERPDDMEEHIAELLASGAVVARFAGRCEWGARSLGNRAILARPDDMASFYTVNDQIKARDFWMPFAPSLLDRRAHEVLEAYDATRSPAAHMITAYQATPKGVKDFRAALHQGDQTLRPQVVTSEANPDYYRLLEAFERRTGLPGVLNTSLNLHGYPLVATPEQALFTLENSGLQNLALGHILVSKPQGQR